jgi:hypothetical protein
MFSREQPVRRARQPRHQTLFDAPQASAKSDSPHIYRIGQGSIFLTDVYELYAPEK